MTAEWSNTITNAVTLNSFQGLVIINEFQHDNYTLREPYYFDYLALLELTNELSFRRRRNLYNL
jgi:hypothetical protein